MILSVCVLLTVAASAADDDEPAVWRVPLDAGEWKALPGEVRDAEVPRRFAVMDGPIAAVPAGPAYEVRREKGATAFEVVGRVPDLRRMK